MSLKVNLLQPKATSDKRRVSVMFWWLTKTESLILISVACWPLTSVLRFCLCANATLAVCKCLTVICSILEPPFSEDWSEIQCKAMRRKFIQRFGFHEVHIVPGGTDKSKGGDYENRLRPDRFGGLVNLKQWHLKSFTQPFLRYGNPDMLILGTLKIKYQIWKTFE